MTHLLDHNSTNGSPKAHRAFVEQICAEMRHVLAYSPQAEGSYPYAGS